MTQKKIKVFVDGEVLVLDHFSGIGHYTASLLQEVDKLLEDKEYSNIKIEIGLPWRLSKRIEKFGYKNFKIRRMPISPRISNGLKRRGLIPPIDLFFGRKTYVFTHFSSWPTLFSPQIPIIYDLSFIHFPQFSAERNQEFLTDQTEISIKRATRVITISENSKKEIADHYQYSPENIDKVIPILDTKKFRPQTPATKKGIRAKYSLFDDYILFVGNIEPRKNLVSLLKAYENMQSDLQKNFALLLVGAKGWKDNEIHNQIENMQSKGLKVILPTSYVEDADLPALYSAASAFAYVSVYEGYGIPPTEAMACGTAVLSSNNSSLPEAVGDAALTVNALDVKEITKGLESILSDAEVADRLKTKGYKRIKKLDTEENARIFLHSIIKSSEGTEKGRKSI